MEPTACPDLGRRQVAPFGGGKGSLDEPQHAEVAAPLRKFFLAEKAQPSRGIWGWTISFESHSAGPETSFEDSLTSGPRARRISPGKRLVSSILSALGHGPGEFHFESATAHSAGQGVGFLVRRM